MLKNDKYLADKVNKEAINELEMLIYLLSIEDLMDRIFYIKVSDNV